MQEYGTVISTQDGPTTRRFSFVINSNSVVKRGQFVQVRTQEGELIGRISDIYRTNRYFMRPEAVKEYESAGRPLSEIFPVDNWEYLIASVDVLGVYSHNGFQDSLIPPSPGTKVKEPDLNILSNFFGLDKNGIHIGNLLYHEDLKVCLNPTRLLQKHLAILAISGAGKSYLTSVIIEELLDRKPEDGQIAVIVLDTHGEYVSFADDSKYSNRTRVFPLSEIKIGISNLSARTIHEFFPKLSYVQIRELSKVMNKLGNNYSIEDLIRFIEESDDVKSSTKDILLSVLEEMKMTSLFGIKDYPPVDELARQGFLSVIDLSETTSLHKKQTAVAYIAKKLFTARRKGIISPFLLVVEEAHQFAPEKTKKEHAVSKGIIQTLAREGRKFHASLCLISQRPVQLSTTALSQCNTHIILRVTNPYDIEHIGKSSEGLNKSVLKQISTMRVGTALIVGEAVNYPMFVKVRQRSSKISEKGLPLEKAAVEFYMRSKQISEDAKSFM